MTAINSPFQLRFHLRLQSTSASYIALDSVRLIDCYQGDDVA